MSKRKSSDTMLLMVSVSMSPKTSSPAGVLQGVGFFSSDGPARFSDSALKHVIQVEPINSIEEGVMPDINGTKTEKNLQEAFAGESQARNKYTYFASVAKKEGYERIAEYFLETAENEKEHAKLHFKYLGGIGSTRENLKAAAAGEREEHTDMYPRMAREAREEGFDAIASVFEAIGRIEQGHKQRFLKLLEEVETGTFFAKDTPVKWRCRNCGHIHQGTKAPKTCPVCNHPESYFELVEDHY